MGDWRIESQITQSPILQSSNSGQLPTYGFDLTERADGGKAAAQFAHAGSPREIAEQMRADRPRHPRIQRGQPILREICGDLRMERLERLQMFAEKSGGLVRRSFSEGGLRACPP